MGGGDVFLVDGDGDGGPWRGIGRGECAAAFEEIANRGAGREFERAGGVREMVAEKAESEESDAHAFFIICEAQGIGRFAQAIGNRQ